MTTNNSYTSGSSGNYTYSNKQGADGRYTTNANGNVVLKWNDYDVRFGQSTCTANHLGVVMQVDNNPPSRYGVSDSDILGLLSRFADAVEEHRFNLAVDVAQISQTYSSTLNILRSLGNAGRSIRHGDFIGAMSALGSSSGGQRRFSSQDISSRWLEVQYGWLPLLSDVERGWNLTQRSNSERNTTVRASISRSSLWDGSPAPSLYTGKGRVDTRVSIVGELYEDLSITRSLGLLDPLSLVWELVPYSFVVDWFLPIGSYLSALNIIPHLKGRFRLTTVTKYDNRAVDLGLNPAYAGSTGRFRYYYLRRENTALGDIPFPSFVSLPDALSPRRLYNAIALAHQRIS